MPVPCSELSPSLGLVHFREFPGTKPFRSIPGTKPNVLCLSTILTLIFRLLCSAVFALFRLFLQYPADVLSANRKEMGCTFVYSINNSVLKRISLSKLHYSSLENGGLRARVLPIEAQVHNVLSHTEREFGLHGEGKDGLVRQTVKSGGGVGAGVARAFYTVFPAPPARLPLARPSGSVRNFGELLLRF